MADKYLHACFHSIPLVLAYATSTISFSGQQIRLGGVLCIRSDHHSRTGQLMLSCVLQVYRTQNTNSGNDEEDPSLAYPAEHPQHTTSVEAHGLTASYPVVSWETKHSCWPLWPAPSACPKRDCKWRGQQARVTNTTRNCSIHISAIVVKGRVGCRPLFLDKDERGKDLSFHAALYASNEEHIKARLHPGLSSSLCAFESCTHRTGPALEDNHGVGTLRQRSYCKKFGGALVQAGWL